MNAKDHEIFDNWDLDKAFYSVMGKDVSMSGKKAQRAGQPKAKGGQRAPVEDSEESFFK
jgi:hypothetical protein